MHRSLYPPFQAVEYRHRSRVLEGNPWDDPVERSLWVLVPPDGLPAGPVPCIWVLSGFGGTGPRLLNYDPWEENLPERLGRLYAEGRIGPAVFALPDCFTFLGGSQYLNSPAVGRYEDYLVQELVPLVEQHYRVRAHGVVGKSSGGYGAFIQAARHPELFRACACHSGDMAFEYCYLPDFPKFLRHLDQLGGLDAYLEAYRQMRARGQGPGGPWHASLNVLAMAACYSPDPEAPYGIALPVDLETGALRPEVWERWLALDPVRLAPRVAGALQSLRLLYVDCGRQDEFNLLWGARQLHRLLQQLGIPHVYEEFDGGHFGTAHRYDVSLPLLYRALAEA
ncbi:esterase [Thermaerobacter marianensis DSM 12885]|uniref:Esterase n=1 Tax=Thermaerobacter marianensis (strain ATCC 700841 / DSM 12885 / JCM 10246 / 7p75a) TaxID=644966 RepID=E6SGA0_THEM7|nr:alpha/beta hydrolase-fold protein [Thermaerobacter marianensis]ADU50517.1 esterase [Thermaerobacter marianensis DSM 12885]